MDDQRIQHLIDRIEISDTTTRYFTGLDHRDWQAVRATLADTIDLDFSQLFGDPAATLDSDVFVEFARRTLSGFRATQHLSTNHLVEIHGQTATCRAYMFAWHTVPTTFHLEDIYVVRGHYLCSMTRTDDGWRVRGLHMTVWDEAGNKGTYALARERFEHPEPAAVVGR